MDHLLRRQKTNLKGLLGEPSGKFYYFVLYPLKDSPDPTPSLVFLPPYEEEAKNPSPPMNVDKTGSQSSTMKEPWPEDFDRAFRPPKYQRGCESQFESRFFKACNESPVIPPPTGWEDPETNMIVVKGRLIELDDEVIKDAAETSPPIPDHFLPLKKSSYLQNACPTSRWHSRPLPTWGGKGSSSRRKPKEDQAQPQKTISLNIWIQQQVDKEAKQQKPLKLKSKPPVY